MVVASHLNFKLGEVGRIEKALSKAKIRVERLGFEIIDKKTWQRGYRIIRRLIIYLLVLKRFLYQPEIAFAHLTAITESFFDVVLPEDDVKWLGNLYVLSILNLL